ncbi:MAG: hypothetical protein ACFFBC_15590 [Promethearchaeota archaeon]
MKSLRKSETFLIGTIFLLCVCSQIQLNIMNNNFNKINNHDFGLLQLSNSNINIISPENITYSAPMSGHYPGTFGFENSVDGESQPKGFNNTYALNCSGEIVSEVNGHKKVLRAYDYNSSGSAIIRQKFSDVGFDNQTFGTIEYWLLVSSNGVNTEIRLCYGYGKDEVAVNLRISGTGRWQFANLTWTELPNIPRPLEDTWYHIRIHFRCLGAPSYLGLGENKFEIIINGISSGSLDFSVSASEIVMFAPIHTAAGPYNNNACLDALAYSWDPSYNIGDNMDEGLLLSYDTNIDFIWEAYSLDGQVNKTIFGNTTIPLPESGIHSIKISGSDISATQYQSDTIYFTIDLSPKGDEPIIPGYNFYFLICISCLFFVVLIKTCKNQKSYI